MEKKKLQQKISDYNNQIQKEQTNVDKYKDQIKNKDKGYVSTKLLLYLYIALLVSVVVNVFIDIFYFSSEGVVVNSVILILALLVYVLHRQNRITQIQKTTRLYWELSKAEKRKTFIFRHPNDELDIISRNHLKQINISELCVLKYKQWKYDRVVKKHSQLSQKLLDKDRKVIDNNKE
ncbi:membrane protein [Staphylococcus phage CF5]|uniref:Membrane protein n=1 Tax=Staphylococcus phage CF5 TaxID=3113739 RepID=A0AAX4J7C2_9CAUD|nr:membrane protein [Staphylococcus phage CF5]